jgi:hypothetical protein
MSLPTFISSLVAGSGYQTANSSLNVFIDSSVDGSGDQTAIAFGTCPMQCTVSGSGDQTAVCVVDQVSGIHWYFVFPLLAQLDPRVFTAKFDSNRYAAQFR